MLGRATRLCSEIGKTHFNIFDAVGIYDRLQKYTEMKPVVKKQNYSIGDLYESLSNASTEEEATFYREQLVAKIQRKKQRLNEEGRKKFEELSNGKNVDEWVKKVQSYTPQVAKQHDMLFEYMEKYRVTGERRYISNKEDKVEDKPPVQEPEKVELPKEEEIEISKSEVAASSSSVAVEVVQEEVKVKKTPVPKKQKEETEAKPITLEDIVQEYIKKIEDAKASEHRVNISFVPGEKVKFDDKYPIFSSPARTEIHEIINILCKNSTMKKYEIFELLIYNGLKSLFNAE
jgi:type I site-specific restriction endonuclease